MGGFVSYPAAGGTSAGDHVVQEGTVRQGKVAPVIENGAAVRSEMAAGKAQAGNSHTCALDIQHATETSAADRQGPCSRSDDCNRRGEIYSGRLQFGRDDSSKTCLEIDRAARMRVSRV